MSAAWKQFHGDLAASTDRDFERLALGLLRLRWPALVQPPALKHLDRKGIDLVDGLRGKSANVVIQCKGFYEREELTESSYGQIKRSIDKFIASDFTCRHYVLLHNRSGKNPEIRQKIADDLARVIAAGKAKTTKLWSLETFVRDYKKLVRQKLKAALDSASDRSLERVMRLFGSEIYVPIVPVSEQRLAFEGEGRQKLSLVHGPQLESPARLISQANEARWSLLTGLFGSGKTCAALRAAHESDRIIIYVPCAELSFREGAVNTTGLMEALLRSLDVFVEFDGAVRDRLLRLSSKSLADLLVGDNDAILIFDGLDENRQYSTPAGVQTLSNALAELRCPIVMTTRREHFEATFANFEYLLLELSSKGGKRRQARILNLEPWTMEQVDEFLAGVIEAAGTTAAETLVRLRADARSSNISPGEKELLQHPLFLQMITGLAAEGIQSGSTSAEVLQVWTENKLRRDLQVDRPLPTEVQNWRDYTNDVGGVLENIAASMVQDTGSEILLAESIPESVAIAFLRAAFPETRQDAITLTSASFLTPVGPRISNSGAMSFSLRVFQEFYLARYLVRTSADWTRYPPEVQKLCTELTCRSLVARH